MRIGQWRRRKFVAEKEERVTLPLWEEFRVQRYAQKFIIQQENKYQQAKH